MLCVCVSVSSLYHKLIIHNNSSLLCTKEVPQLGQKISTKYKIIGKYEIVLQSRRVEWTRKGEKDITAAARLTRWKKEGGLVATTVTKVKQDIREFLSRAGGSIPIREEREGKRDKSLLLLVAASHILSPAVSLTAERACH